MNRSDFLELVAMVAGYVVEQESDSYPYVTQEINGYFVTNYTDEAHERFNQHHDVIEELIGFYLKDAANE